MKEMKKLNVVLALMVVAVFAVLSLNPLKAHADTVTMALENTGGQSSGGEYVYPYYFNVNNGSTTAPLMCLGYYNEIQPGESWTATIEQITGNAEYEAAAYIFSQASAPSATNSQSDQIAIAQWSNWALFETQKSPADFLSEVVPTQYQGEVTSLLDAAAAYVLANPSSSLYSQYQMYVPSSGWPSGSDTPQTFIGDAPTPEPGSMILLGTGMFVLAAFWFRRKRLA
jgi:hypothetical protein